MTFGSGSMGWLGFLTGLAFVAGVVLIVAWAVGAAGRTTEDDANAELRRRFARGEIDGRQFEEMQRVLGPAERPRAGARLGLVGLLLVGGALVAGLLLGWLGFGGWGPMMGPGMWSPMGSMMGGRPAPTAPADTSVAMAGSRFEPSTLTVSVGETVRWFNDDALPHTVSATDGSWDSGNLAPGARFERSFTAAGSYPYLCRYHPGMAGTIEVRGP